MFIKNLFLILAFFLASSAYAHSPYPHWPAPGSPLAPNICPYNQSSVCHTYSGNACSMFTANYQPNWFSACVTGWPFYACLNLPAFPQPFVQNVCYLRGSPCVCSFGLINGMYIYEPGQVL